MNQFGKQQSDLDLKADEIIFNHLRKSGVVHSAASEEKPYVSQTHCDISIFDNFEQRWSITLICI
jgi:fructose-1,6-bisphosphatase